MDDAGSVSLSLASKLLRAVDAKGELTAVSDPHASRGSAAVGVPLTAMREVLGAERNADGMCIQFHYRYVSPHLLFNRVSIIIIPYLHH
jgi:hypothetical protein